MDYLWMYYLIFKWLEIFLTFCYPSYWYISYFSPDAFKNFKFSGFGMWCVWAIISSKNILSLHSFSLLDFMTGKAKILLSSASVAFYLLKKIIKWQLSCGISFFLLLERERKGDGEREKNRCESETTIGCFLHTP